jgi:hypothetical protein
VAVHSRYRWRYLAGIGHPASGQTQWHLASHINLDVFARSLHAFAQPIGAKPTKEVVLDRAGWHASARLEVPEHLHLVPLPAYTPELQPAEHLWGFTNTPLVNACPADLEHIAAAVLRHDGVMVLSTRSIAACSMRASTSASRACPEGASARSSNCGAETPAFRHGEEAPPLQ